MASSWFRSSRLFVDDAHRHARRDGHHRRVSINLLQLLHQPAGHATPMSTSLAPTTPQFDAFAENYDDALAQGIAVSGEQKEYFAQGRTDWLKGCLRQLD